MFKKRLFITVVSILLSNFASAASIVNGNFDTDLSGWNTLSNGGLAQWDGGAAILSTSSGVAAPSSLLVQGDDGSFSFANPIQLKAGNEILRFDAIFSDLGADSLETPPGPFTDNLQVWLYDANDPSTNSDALLATIDILTSGTSFSIDLANYIGQFVAFSFELYDENDGRDSSVRLDNIRLEPAAINAVPSPSTLLLMVIGWVGLMRVLQIEQKVQ